MKTKLLPFLVVLLFFGSTIIVVTGCDCNNRKTTIKNNDSNKYALGLILDYNENGYLIPNPVTLGGGHPSKWDWRHAEYNGTTGDWTTGIRYQGYCGSCWAFGAIAVLETVYNIQMGDPDIDLDLSEQLLVSCGMLYSPTLIGCCGGYLMDALNFLTWYGTVPEACFPYQGVDHRGRDFGDCNLGDKPSNEPVKCSDKCTNWESEIIKTKGFRSLNDQDSIKNAICSYGPVVAGFAVYEDFMEYKGGVYEKKSDKYVGGHVVAIVGYDDEQECWICKNSWSEEWGEPNPYDPNSKGGWFRIKYGECGIDIPGTTAYLDGFTKSKSYNNFLPMIFELLLNKLLKKPLFVFLIN